MGLREHWFGGFWPPLKSCALQGNLEMWVSYINKRGLTETWKKFGTLETVLRHCHDVLSVLHFYTCNSDEVRSWTVPKGLKAPAVAGYINADMEDNFVSVEVMKLKDLLEFQSERRVRVKERCMIKGKDYKIEDGDVVAFQWRHPNELSQWF